MVGAGYSKFDTNVRLWWVYLLAGVPMIPMGIWTLVTPFITYAAFVIPLSGMLLITGLLQLIFALANTKSLHAWGWYLTAGLIDLIFGAMLSWSPALEAVALPYFAAFWLMFKSLNGLGYAIDIKNFSIKGWGWLMEQSILVLLFSLFLVFSLNPAVQAMFVDALVAYGLIIWGIATITLGICIRRIRKTNQ